MKYLIVNADDFGYSYSVNKGIIEAHTRGVVTSTSVMVDAIAADDAKNLVQFPKLSIGLHFEVQAVSNVSTELERQIKRFISIVGRSPDHIDTHKRHTTDDDIKFILKNYATARDIPVRIFSAKHIGSFGINSIDSSIKQLKRSIDEVTEGYNELMTHVGYSDDYLRDKSSYSTQRECELKSICSDEIKLYIDTKGIILANWSIAKEQK